MCSSDLSAPPDPRARTRAKTRKTANSAPPDPRARTRARPRKTTNSAPPDPRARTRAPPQKTTVEIMGETISFAPRKAIKSQVLADFVAEWVDTQLPTAPIQLELWTMFFDGSLMKTGPARACSSSRPSGSTYATCYASTSRHPTTWLSTRLW